MKNTIELWDKVHFTEDTIPVKIGDRKVELDIFSKITFKDGSTDVQIICLPFTSLYQDIVQKVTEDSFNFQDFNNLISFLSDLHDKIVRLFQIKASKLRINPAPGQIIMPVDPIFKKILDTIEVNFSNIGRFFESTEIKQGIDNYYNPSRKLWYLQNAEIIYKIYLSCLLFIESLTNYHIHKGVPLHMLGLIYGNSGRIMEMLPQLGMTLKEDRSIKISGAGDNLLEFLNKQISLEFQDTYETIKDDFKSYTDFQRLPDDIYDIFDDLRKNVSNFPENALIFLNQKFSFMQPFLKNYMIFDDVFTSFLRMDLLIFFTGFIETLLKRVLNSSDTIMRLINNFNSFLPFNMKELNIAQNHSFNSYQIFTQTHNYNAPDYYQDFCDFILSLTPINTTDQTKLDISSDEKLSTFQASMILWRTRNKFHHDFYFSPDFTQISIRDDVPKILKYLSNVEQLMKILFLMKYYTCLILIIKFIGKIP